MAGVKGIYRKARDAVKKDFLKKGTPQRWVFTLRPTCIEGVPRSIKQLVLEWKGAGSKLSFTKVQPVNSQGLVIFDETLTMTTTLYKGESGFEAKPYTLMAMDVQEVKSMGRRVDKTVSIATYKLDFSHFTRTALEHAGAEEEIEVGLRGSKGVNLVLRAFVKASLLKDWQPDPDSSNSELSFMSMGGTPTHHDDEYVDDDDDSQDLPGLGHAQGSSMSMLSDDSDVVHPNTRMPSPGRDKGQHTAAKKQALISSLSLDSSTARSHRSRDAHNRARSVDWGLETITEADQSMRWSGRGTGKAAEAPEPDGRQSSASKPHKSTASSPAQPDHLQGTPSGGLPQTLNFLNRVLLGNKKPAGDLNDLTPEELRVEAARRETVDIRAEEDILSLREHAVQLVYAREILKAKNNELKQLLTESQNKCPSDEAALVQELVQAKLQIADAAYENLHLQSALQASKNKNRKLSAKLTQAAVERDLMAHRLSEASQDR